MALAYRMCCEREMDEVGSERMEGVRSLFLLMKVLLPRLLMRGVRCGGR